MVRHGSRTWSPGRIRSPSPRGGFVVLLFTATALAMACASARTRDPDLRRRASEIRVLTAEEIGDRRYEVVAEVEGTSCAPNPETDPSLEGARTDMRIEAAERGADAIVHAICEEVGLSIAPGCSRRIECRGDAIRWR